MKKLLLVRHAKSSWQDASQDDHERPLNQRGLRDAPRMGAFLAEHCSVPQIIFSSTANRAKTTASIIADAFGITDKLVASDALYTFSAHSLLGFIIAIDNHYDYVMLTGHNPAITELVTRLSNTDIDNVPTCGVALLSVAYNEWGAFTQQPVELEMFVTPKTI